MKNKAYEHPRYVLIGVKLEDIAQAKKERNRRKRYHQGKMSLRTYLGLPPKKLEDDNG